MYKQIFSLLILCFVSLRGQTTIKDFVLPKEGMNKSIFITPDPVTGEEKGLVLYRWFIPRDNILEIFDNTEMMGELVGLKREFYEFTSNEMKLTMRISTNRSVTNKRTDFSPPKTFLKLPPNKKEVVSWTYMPTDKLVSKCSSNYTSIDVQGVKCECLKVVSRVSKLNGNGAVIMTMTEYYVRGIGLYKTMVGKVVMQLLKEQLFDADAKVMPLAP
jgi:hypothetical protein